MFNIESMLSFASTNFYERVLNFRNTKGLDFDKIVSYSMNQVILHVLNISIHLYDHIHEVTQIEKVN